MIETYSPTVLEAEDPESVSRGWNQHLSSASLACNLFSCLVAEGVLWLANASHPPGPIPWFLLSVFVCCRSLCPCMCVDSHPMSCEMVLWWFEVEKSQEILRFLLILNTTGLLDSLLRTEVTGIKNSWSWGYYIPFAPDRQIRIEYIMLDNITECQQWSWEDDSVVSTRPEDLKFGSPESM